MLVSSALSCESLIYVVGRVLIPCLYCWSGLYLAWHARKHVGSTKFA